MFFISIGWKIGPIAVQRCNTETYLVCTDFISIRHTEDVEAEAFADFHNGQILDHRKRFENA